MKICDISKYNKVYIDNTYKSLENIFDGFIIRCGFRGNKTGKIILDSEFLKNYNNLNKKPIGIYFFTTAVTEKESEEEALFVLDLIKKYHIKLSFPIILYTNWCNTKHNGRADNLSKEIRTNILLHFINILSDNGYDTVLYTTDFWFENMIEIDKTNDVFKWIDSKNESSIKYNNIICWRKYTESIEGILGEIGISIWKNEPYQINIDKKFSDGDEIILNEAFVYRNSNILSPEDIKSGIYYIWSSNKRNDRIRITDKKENVKKENKSLGWINISDIIYIEE